MGGNESKFVSLSHNSKKIDSKKNQQGLIPRWGSSGTFYVEFAYSLNAKFFCHNSKIMQVRWIEQTKISMTEFNIYCNDETCVTSNCFLSSKQF